MTPMIDVSFLLIVFFMLVNRIMSEEAVEMILPRPEEPQVVSVGEEPRVVINPMAFVPPGMERGAVHPLAPPGRLSGVKVGLRTIVLAAGWEMELTRELERARERFEGDGGHDRHDRHDGHDGHDGAPLEVLLRADAALSYEHVEPVLRAVAAAGLTRVNLVAYRPGEGPAF